MGFLGVVIGPEGIKMEEEKVKECQIGQHQSVSRIYKSF